MAAVSSRRAGILCFEKYCLRGKFTLCPPLRVAVYCETSPYHPVGDPPLQVWGYVLQHRPAAEAGFDWQLVLLLSACELAAVMAQPDKEHTFVRSPCE